MIDGPLRIASRGSDLALWQTRWVEARLREHHADLEFVVKVLRTTGDRILDVPLARIGDQGLFTKELDLALISREADIAVHSLKDVPTRLPEELRIAAVLPRADPRDVVITRNGTGWSGLGSLPAASRVGTSSLRRRAQLLARRPDLDVRDLRGNLNTRLRRLDGGDYDAIILAAAGVARLGWDDRIEEFLSPPAWLPAVGQGALAIVARSSDEPLLQALQTLHDPLTAACVAAERAFLRAVEGGCQIPVAALAVPERDGLRLDGLVAALDGGDSVRETVRGTVETAEETGRRLAETLLSRGADEILAEVRRNALPAPPFIGP